MSATSSSDPGDTPIDDDPESVGADEGGATEAAQAPARPAKPAAKPKPAKPAEAGLKEVRPAGPGKLVMGRMVRYVIKTDAGGVGDRLALVTRVHAKQAVDLMVFPFPGDFGKSRDPGAVMAVRKVPYFPHEEGQAPVAESWHWPDANE